ncbi:tetraacyldisaccharide 4'-kinase [Ideonella sp. YS5]|uniref:tetraacyldisaccharide 4'-kinase n=1 Tax=Ideonella sp. YS5 TaxID=3453714 RepID=UPI003EE94092
MRLLQPLSLLYSALASLNEEMQRRQSPGRLGAPVVVVGNLVVGGAGKTPTVIALVEWLRREGWQPGVVSRGYGRADDQPLVDVQPDTPAAKAGDEPLLIRRRTGAPVVVARDRVAAAKALLSAHAEVDIVVSDDGLQHHRLPRDVEVLVFDDRGAGNGLVLPAGPLRQALPRNLPPQALVLYNASRPSTSLPGACVRRTLAEALPLSAWWRGDTQACRPLSTLAGRPVVAAAGLGAPERFFSMLEQAGLTIERLPLADHADFSALPWRQDTPDVIVTEKDAVKLTPGAAGGSRVWVVALDFVLPPDFTAALQQRLPRRVDASTPR